MRLTPAGQSQCPGCYTVLHPGLICCFRMTRQAGAGAGAGRGQQVTAPDQLTGGTSGARKAPAARLLLVLGSELPCESSGMWPDSSSDCPRLSQHDQRQDRYWVNWPHSEYVTNPSQAAVKLCWKV